jgi:phage-related tail protein
MNIKSNNSTPAAISMAPANQDKTSPEKAILDDLNKIKDLIKKHSSEDIKELLKTLAQLTQDLKGMAGNKKADFSNDIEEITKYLSSYLDTLTKDLNPLIRATISGAIQVMSGYAQSHVSELSETQRAKADKVLDDLSEIFLALEDAVEREETYKDSKHSWSDWFAAGLDIAQDIVNIGKSVLHLTTGK